MTTTDEAVITNMNVKNYHVALVLLAQIQRDSGTLSSMNQLRMCECLYFTRRYLSALEKAEYFLEAGNKMPELLFLKGMCHYQRGNFSGAHEIFRKRQDWWRWALKSSMEKEAADKCIVIGEIPSKDVDEKVEFQFSDQPKSIKITLNIPGIDPNELKVSLNEYWLEVSYDDGYRKFAKSQELFEKVNAKTLKLTVTNEMITMEIEKAKEGEWPCLHSNTGPAIDTNFAEVLEKMDLVKEYTDEEAARLFEDLIPKMREEAPDISKWFE